MKISDLKTGTRLGLGFGMLAAMLLAIELVAWTQMSLLNSSMDRALSASARITEVKTLGISIDAFYSSLYVLLSTSDSLEEHSNEVLAAERAYTGQLDTLAMRRAEGKEAELDLALAAAANKCREVNTSIADQAMGKDKTPAVAMLNTSGRSCRQHELNPALEALMAYHAADIARLDDESEGALLRAKETMVAAGALALLFTVLASVLLARSIVKPLALSVGHTSKLASGDFREDVPLELRDRADELGTLGKSLQALTVSTRGLLSQVAGNADTVAAASTELSASSTQIAASTEEISTQASSVASAAEQATTGINTISAAAEEISVTTSMVAASIEEMSSSLKEVASSGQQELTASSEATRKAIEGLDIVSRLGASVEAVGRIVGVIDDIASQTNLLALNATIEAATAGAAGKGFAVVATEVKALARQTAAATKEIQDKIGAIQSDSAAAVKIMEVIAVVVDQVNDLSQAIMAAVEQQSTAVTEIARNISGVDAGTKEVARNVGESSQGLRSITKTVHGVSAGVGETAKGLSQVQASAGELARMSESLKALVGRFKV